ncbi:glycine cleavage system aminomethyltransferase GcvT [Ahrensia sp. 13_GOM-1096m]|uniref:glycine cleavage system aminomethyltransferase GcvT n=1 Tax=Ahrensia sp. 13_GOM-1096m TaxID=1380380 RepID=UPI00047B9B3B|nr:glycine cleavage system aminomethyltransferase GcvT [Ahrensia sp. 13_GOM-1096m]
MESLKTTSLHELHLKLGAKMVPFAGYDMPVQYPAGVMKEHLHTRAKAGLFDVSHMGQVILHNPDAALQLESLVPVDVATLPEGRQRYGFFTNETGGILDDIMIANRGDHLFVVVNAGCKDADIAHMERNLKCKVETINNRSLLALQGPASETILSTIVPDVAEMRFMDVRISPSKFGELWISRSGYTGEDGFEISVEDEQAIALAEALLAHEDVLPIGLGARDSLRLESGLCLYGNDIDETTSPLEAGLQWAIQKARRKDGARAGGFPGAEHILAQFDKGVKKQRIGLLPEGRAPMRAGTNLYAHENDETPIGQVTSGAFGPTVERPVSMGYVSAEHSDVDAIIFGDVRGKRLPARICAMPFTPLNFKR